VFKPRPSQIEVLNYQGGKMGIAAVPGSGKTQTLSKLAADLILNANLADDQEILIVTLVNSAVDNFSARIAGFIAEYKMLPNIGFRVRTLHGLANDILKERPDLVGLSNQFQIIEEQESATIIDRIVQNWQHTHSEFIQNYLLPGLDLKKDHQLQNQWFEMLSSLAGNFIRQAKDLLLLPHEIRRLLDKLPERLPLVEMAVDIYSDYQRALNYRAAVDFDDLIRLALKAITIDQEFLKRLQYRWPYILEDEAQDSSQLQEQILRLLSSKENNWVRVGDTNQAIYETFTTADPRFLRDFLIEKGVVDRKLPVSGRSMQSIIDLANHFIKWVNTSHPVLELRDSLTEPLIQPTPLDDPQPNPPDDPGGIRIALKKLEPSEEARLVVMDIKKWLSQNKNKTVAVLVPRNERGAEVVGLLKSQQIPYLELLRSSYSTRKTTEIFASILKYLAEPVSSQKLSLAFHTILEHDQPAFEGEIIGNVSTWIRKCSNLENFFNPVPGKDYFGNANEVFTITGLSTRLNELRNQVRKWQEAAVLPVDQLLLTIALDMMHDPIELALVHKLSLILGTMAVDHPEWNLANFADQLAEIARNERKFLGFSEEDTGFNPDFASG